MCGIAGALVQPGVSHDLLAAIGERLGNAIAHRGPDGSGTWVDPARGVVLSHRRLSVIDASAQGAQPMTSHDGRWVLTFNGEIYNHGAIRSELTALGRCFRGRSDTEVLVEAIAEWGLESTLLRSNGMFAFAAWDRKEGLLWLARDRMGKKPLYYGSAGDGSFVFGSELAAIRAYPGFPVEVEPDALALLLRFDFIPAPHSILRGVHKLAAGQLLRVDRDALPGNALPAPISWWSAFESQLKAIDRGFDGTEASALDAMDVLLRDSIGLRLEADVPLGSFLSGGVDSSLVTALMQVQSRVPVRTFSIGFENDVNDESAQASAVAKHLGTDHTSIFADARAALEVVEDLPRFYDEPFSDSSQIPMVLLCGLTRKHVTVALSGDGGDELFFGYRRYGRILRNDRWLRFLPRGVLARLSGDPGERSRLGGLAALRSELGTQNFQDVARKRMTRWRQPERVVRGASRLSTPYDDPSSTDRFRNREDAIMALDAACYLPECILTKVDRASMAFALEARAPFLDYRVAEFAWSLPIGMKRRGGLLKVLPRRLLGRYLPQELIVRNKSGFGAPVGDWLRGPLREWAEAQLSERRLREEGHFDPQPVLAIWRDFQAGRRKWHSHLWPILMFQAWREKLYG